MQAMGRVLFIDEAYTLASEDEYAFDFQKARKSFTKSYDEKCKGLLKRCREWKFKDYRIVNFMKRLEHIYGGAKFSLHNSKDMFIIIKNAREIEKRFV